ncbi:MAG: metal ABC transporter substrate-binding protein [Culicoidibacterales bacterium]
MKIGKMLILTLLAITMVACTPQKSNGKIQIVTTSNALKQFIETIGADEVEVVFSLTGNPHHFELTQTDAAVVTEADAFINIEAGDYVSIGSKIQQVNNKIKTFNVAQNIKMVASQGDDHDHGEEKEDHSSHDHTHPITMHLEGIEEHYHTKDIVKIKARDLGKTAYQTIQWFIKLENETEFKQIPGLAGAEIDLVLESKYAGAQIMAKQIDTSNNIVGQSEPEKLDIDDHGGSDDHGSTLKESLDPHIWLDPILAQELSEAIAGALIELKPEAKSKFEANSKGLKTKLAALDKKYSTTLSTKTQNKLVVSHAAYIYLTNRYGLEQRGITDTADHSESTQTSLISLDEYIGKNNIKFIYTEENIQANSAINVLKGQHKLQELTLHNIETVTVATDYFTLMEKNLESLAKGQNTTA